MLRLLYAHCVMYCFSGSLWFNQMQSNRTDKSTDCFWTQYRANQRKAHLASCAQCTKVVYSFVYVNVRWYYRKSWVAKHAWQRGGWLCCQTVGNAERHWNTHLFGGISKQGTLNSAWFSYGCNRTQLYISLYDTSSMFLGVYRVHHKKELGSTEHDNFVF